MGAVQDRAREFGCKFYHSEQAIDEGDAVSTAQDLSTWLQNNVITPNRYPQVKNVKDREAASTFSYEQARTDMQKQVDKLNATCMAYPYGYITRNLFLAAPQSNLRMAYGFRHYDYSTRKDFRYNIVRIKISARTSWREFKKWLNRY